MTWIDEFEKVMSEFVVANNNYNNTVWYLSINIREKNWITVEALSFSFFIYFSFCLCIFCIFFGWRTRPCIRGVERRIIGKKDRNLGRNLGYVYFWPAPQSLEIWERNLSKSARKFRIKVDRSTHSKPWNMYKYRLETNYPLKRDPQRFSVLP